MARFLRRFARAGVTAGLAAAFGIGGLASCGARTGLDTSESCARTGDTRPCEGVCGPGVQTCDKGYWQSCVPPNTTRDCTDACGQGTQVCTESGWQSCVVPDASRACSNSCGTGSQQCVANAWQTCEVLPTSLACSSVCSSGTQPCANDTPGVCDAPQPHDPVLSATFLDFRSTQPDFEGTAIVTPNTGNRSDLGIVAPLLGADGLPVYTGTPTTPTTTGKADFDLWFRPTPGVNQAFELALPMTQAVGKPGYFTYSNQQFFLLDGVGFGDDGQAHNFDFTMHTQTSFVYAGGETFSMLSDDDSWLFINRQLAIDLGGLHDSTRGSIALDTAATRLGLLVGSEYPLDIFYVERHITGAAFSITCTIAPRHQCE